MASKSKFWALVRGDYVAAGDLYFQEGKLAKAAQLYAKGGHYTQAARLSARLGDERRAVALYLKAGSPLEAGELLAANGKHKEAIPYFEQARAFWQAAESSLRLQQTLRAARFFEKARAPTRAAESYERAGEIEEALRLWDQESRRLKLEIRHDPAKEEARRKVDLHRSELLARVGSLAQAAELLREWGLTGKAAQLLERAECYEDAAEAYLEAGEPMNGLRLLSKAPGLDRRVKVGILRRCGQHAEAAKLYEELEEFGEAAEAFEVAGEWARAAKLWEQAEEPTRAADLFYRAEVLEDAARCYAKAKNFKMAAETYAKGGYHKSAADCYLRIEQPLQAAKRFLEGQSKSEAAKALQLIPETSADFGEATLLLVPLLIEEGLYEGALHRLRLLPEGSSVDGMAVDRYYWEGRALEALNKYTQAEVSYQKTLSLRRDHRDVPDRLEELRERKARETPVTPGAALGGDGTVVQELNPGEVLVGRYEILEEIGRGGMSRVYKALDRELGENVAIKTLLPRPGDHLQSEERLLREVQICRRITHPSVVRVYDIGRFERGIFVTMELLEGITLDKLIKMDTVMPLVAVKKLFKEILLGLREAHELKIIHRDLKPANVILTNERAKIMDFGIAYVEDTDVTLTQTGQVIGSPMYMSPEQIQGQDLDARSDLYSFGILSYTTLARQEPFTAKTATAVAMKHLNEPPPNIRDQRSDMSEEWQQFLAKLLAKRPEDRYQTAQDVLAVVERLPA